MTTSLTERRTARMLERTLLKAIGAVPDDAIAVTLEEVEPGRFTAIGIIVRPGLTETQRSRVARVLRGFPKAVEAVVGGPIQVRCSELARA